VEGSGGSKKNQHTVPTSVETLSAAIAGRSKDRLLLVLLLWLFLELVAVFGEKNWKE